MGNKIILASIAIFTAIIAAPAFSDEIVACVNSNSGSMRIVADTGECRNNESPLTWNQQIPADDNDKTLTMVDAQDKAIGQIVNHVNANSAEVITKIGDRAVLLSVLTSPTQHVVLGSQGAFAFHTQLDCNSPAYFPFNSFVTPDQQFVLNTLAGQPGLSLYLLDFEDNGQSLTIRSQSFYDTNTHSWQCFNFGGSGFPRNDLHELTDPVADLSQFVSPFRIEGISEIPELTP